MPSNIRVQLAVVAAYSIPMLLLASPSTESYISRGPKRATKDTAQLWSFCSAAPMAVRFVAYTSVNSMTGAVRHVCTAHNSGCSAVEKKEKKEKME